MSIHVLPFSQLSRLTLSPPLFSSLKEMISLHTLLAPRKQTKPWQFGGLKECVFTYIFLEFNVFFRLTESSQYSDQMVKTLFFSNHNYPNSYFPSFLPSTQIEYLRFGRRSSKDSQGKESCWLSLKVRQRERHSF